MAGARPPQRFASRPKGGPRCPQPQAPSWWRPGKPRPSSFSACGSATRSKEPTPAGTWPCSRWNGASAPAKVIEILSPGGLEAYFEELAPVLERHGAPQEYYDLARNYGITIQDDWIEELERAYGVKL